MTRARQELYLTCATGRMLYGGVQHNPPSRFLSEIDANFVQSDTMNGSYDTYMPSSQPNKPVSNEPRYVPELNEGDGVRHPQFGMGTVLEVEGDNATIYFRGKGTRKLNVSFAPLEKL
jgi:DNA helicase-2/ATP-dependent DNA helicase PcrA